MKQSIAVSCVWPLAAELGEGPLWWRKALWFTDIKKHLLHRLDPATGEKQSWPAPSPIGFLAPRANGHFIAGAQQGLMDFDPSTGNFALLRAIEPDKPGNRLNDGAVDPQGRLWFGSMDNAEKEPTGTLYRFAHGELAAVNSGHVIPNGPAFSPDGTRLYLTDTLARRIYVFELGANGSLSNKRLFVEIEKDAGHPDGPVVDSEGCLWTALFGGWAVRRYSPEGRLLQTVSFPAANVSKIAFGGDDLRTAYATTATKGLSKAELEKQPLAGALFSFAAPAPGVAATALAEN